MGSDGGGQVVQWADALINAGATFFAAVMAAGVAVWLANRERRDARKQRAEDRKKNFTMQQMMRKQDLVWQMKLATLASLERLLEDVRRLEHAASLNNPENARFSLTSMYHSANQLKPFNRDMSDTVYKLATDFPENGAPQRLKAIVAWASDAETELSAMYAALSLWWYSNEAGVEVPDDIFVSPDFAQAASDSDESSADESDAKSSS